MINIYFVIIKTVINDIFIVIIININTSIAKITIVIITSVYAFVWFGNIG